MLKVCFACYCVNFQTLLLLISTTFLSVSGTTSSTTAGGDNSETSLNNKDHHQSPIAFGEGTTTVHIPVVDSLSKSISAKGFFTAYVKNQQPVLFKGAILKSKAYQSWSDQYFKTLQDIPEGHNVLVESRKKENRTVPPTRMPFKEFVEIYNHTDQYMVEPVPIFLRLV